MPRPSRSFLLASLALGAACASSGGAPVSAQTDRILAVENGNVIRSTSDENDRAVIPAPVAKVWTALVASYADLGISPTVNEQDNGRYGNMGFVVTSIKNRPVSALFSCGSGLGGGFGGSGRVTATVVTQLSPAAAGETAIVTHVSAKYRSNDGSSTAAIDCGSTGVLEGLLRNAVTLRVARGAP